MNDQDRIVYEALQTRHLWGMLRRYRHLLRHLDPNLVEQRYRETFTTVNTNYCLYVRDNNPEWLTRAANEACWPLLQLFGACNSAFESNRLRHECKILISRLSETFRLPPSLLCQSDYVSCEEMQDAMRLFIFLETTYVTRVYWRI